MRYIVASGFAIDTLFIAEGVPFRDRSGFRPAHWNNCTQQRYKIVWTNSRRSAVLVNQIIIISSVLFVSQHYDSFEAFMSDHVELFL
jgi:hypothetical protein